MVLKSVNIAKNVISNLEIVEVICLMISRKLLNCTTHTFECIDKCKAFSFSFLFSNVIA